MLCEYVQKLEDYDEEIEELLITLLYHLVNNFHYLTYEKEELKEKTDQLARYHRISKYIYNNYNNNITLQEIAKDVYKRQPKFPELNKKLKELAEKYNVSSTAIATAWILRHPAKIQTIVAVSYTHLDVYKRQILTYNT